MYDLAVVGAGPGGYPGALAAAEKGLRVLVVEEARPGGECVLYGCVPSKAVLRAAAAVAAVRSLGGRACLGWSDALAEAVRLAERLSSGVEMLLGRRGIELARSHGVLVRPGRLLLDGEPVEARRILLAPGGEPSAPPGVVVDEERVLSNRGVFTALRDAPERLLIVGGGAAGVELAQVFAVLGSSVVLVEALERLLPGMDMGLGRYAARLLRRLGVKAMTRCPLEALERRGGGVEARLCGHLERFDAVIVATGRKSRAPEALSGEMRKRLLAGKGFLARRPGSVETLVEGVYAAGDAAGPPMLAHKAIHESLAAGLAAAGEAEPRAPGRLEVPMVVYGLVELAQVGYPSAQAARSNGFDASEARIRLGGVAYAAIEHAEDGYVNLVYERSSGRLLGVSAAAPHASDIAATAAVMIAAGLTVDEALQGIHPHPSASEALYEALLAAKGTPLHYLARR